MRQYNGIGALHLRAKLLEPWNVFSGGRTPLHVLAQHAKFHVQLELNLCRGTIFLRRRFRRGSRTRSWWRGPHAKRAYPLQSSGHVDRVRSRRESRRKRFHECLRLRKFLWWAGRFGGSVVLLVCNVDDMRIHRLRCKQILRCGARDSPVAHASAEGDEHQSCRCCTYGGNHKQDGVRTPFPIERALRSGGRRQRWSMRSGRRHGWR